MKHRIWISTVVSRCIEVESDEVPEYGNIDPTSPLWDDVDNFFEGIDMDLWNAHDIEVVDVETVDK